MNSPDSQIPSIPPDPKNVRRQGWIIIGINAALYLAALFVALFDSQAPAAAIALIIVVNLIIGVYLALKRSPLAIWFLSAAIAVPIGLLLIGFGLCAGIVSFSGGIH